MLLEEIITAAEKLVGEGSDMLSDICGMVYERLSSCLKEEITPEDCGRVFVFASAVAAADIYKSIKPGSGLVSYSAGTVSVTRKGGAKDWEEIFSRAENMLSQYISDCGFVFMGVDG